ncbi:hypothetical protein EXT61_07450 [Pectobacterium parmentieri]|nr:hypothetical protein [Pectobacterium parmentieri]
MLRRVHDGEPCIYQLFHTEKSLCLTRELSVVIHKCGNLNCLPDELHSVINEIVYEYINSTIGVFFEIIDNNFKGRIILDECLKYILAARVSNFKKRFSSTLYQFPVVIFNLDREVKLSENIRLIPIDSTGLKEKELMMFNETRPYKSNFFLEVFVKVKCSQALSLQLAEKSRDTTYNILKLLATHLSPQAIPLLTSNDRVMSPFHFYRYGPNGNDFSNATIRNFAYFQFHSKEFWDEFHKNQNIDDGLITLAFQIVELLLIPNFSNERVAERFERALLWYGDAVTEYIPFQQIQKIVSSMEALINFHDGDITEKFKRRITNLHVSHKGLNEDIREKAGQLYDARSKIIHGSSHNEKLNFCIINFCSETLLRAIYYFSIFGFDKTGFRKSLPKFLDEIPINIEPKINP